MLKLKTEKAHLAHLAEKVWTTTLTKSDEWGESMAWLDLSVPDEDKKCSFNTIFVKKNMYGLE